MKNFTDLQCPLFADIDADELEGVLTCLNARIIEYRRNNIIINEGDTITKVYLVYEGECRIVRNDFLGNHSIIATLTAGDLFGESFAACSEHLSKVNIIAASDCQIISLDYNKIITTCPNSCKFHHTVIKNMLKILAERNISLTEKIELLSKRTTRDKLIAYFTNIAKRSSNHKIVLPFNRQELADFLSVDRSSMCRELSKMQNDGIIEINKNTIHLKHVGEIK